MYKTKVCRTCQKRKTVDKFSMGANHKPMPDCKICRNTIARKKYHKRKKYGTCTHCGKKCDKNRLFCKKCINNSITNFKKRRHKYKRNAVEYKGGKCQKCGFQSKYFMVYDFHHINNKNKKDEIGDMIDDGIAWAKIVKELDKCLLLCSNCHRILHHKERCGDD